MEYEGKEKLQKVRAILRKELLSKELEKPSKKEKEIASVVRQKIVDMIARLDAHEAEQLKKLKEKKEFGVILL